MYSQQVIENKFVVTFSPLVCPPSLRTNCGIRIQLSVVRFFWNGRLFDIAESLAHLLFDIRRLDCGIAIAID